MKDKLTNGEKSIDEEQLAHQKDLETPVGTRMKNKQWDRHLLNIQSRYMYLKVFQYINNNSNLYFYRSCDAGVI